jgi:hypothetical protein
MGLAHPKQSHVTVPRQRSRHRLLTAFLRVHPRQLGWNAGTTGGHFDTYLASGNLEEEPLTVSSDRMVALRESINMLYHFNQAAS